VTASFFGGERANSMPDKDFFIWFGFLLGIYFYSGRSLAEVTLITTHEETLLRENSEKQIYLCQKCQNCRDASDATYGSKNAAQRKRFFTQ